MPYPIAKSVAMWLLRQKATGRGVILGCVFSSQPKATKEGDETHIIGKNFFQLLVAMFSYRGFGKKE
jgi:hypothetical protein